MPPYATVSCVFFFIVTEIVLIYSNSVCGTVFFIEARKVKQSKVFRVHTINIGEEGYVALFLFHHRIEWGLSG